MCVWGGVYVRMYMYINITVNNTKISVVAYTWTFYSQWNQFKDYLSPRGPGLSTLKPF